MAGLALICVEGVLTQRSERFVEAQPIVEGLVLYQALKSAYRVALSTFEESSEHVEHWLKMNGLNGHLHIFYRPAEIVTEIGCRDDHVQRARVLAPLSLFVSPDPQSVAKATYNGVTSVLFAHPSYQRPEHRPDALGSIRPWSVIEDELQRQALLRKNSDAPKTGDLV